MKTFLIVTVVIFAVVFLSQAFVMSSSSDIEQHPYIVLETFEDFEIRQYAPALFSSVNMDANSYESTSSSGFRVLAGYIFGGNEESKSIAMTSPVRMEIGDSSKMSFMVPKEYTVENLPKPNNSKIYFEADSQKVMAAIEFGGWANDEKIKSYQEKLNELLTKNGFKHKGNFAYLGYNPPYQILNRRNEIVVELDAYQIKN
jgi:hypothetical protein